MSTPHTAPPPETEVIDALIQKLQRNRKWLASFMGVSRPTLYRYLATDGPHRELLQTTIRRLRRLADAQVDPGADRKAARTLPVPEHDLIGFMPTGSTVVVPISVLPDGDHSNLVTVANSDGSIAVVMLASQPRFGRVTLIQDPENGSCRLAALSRDQVGRIRVLGVVVAILTEYDTALGAFGRAVWDIAGLSS